MSIEVTPEHRPATQTGETCPDVSKLGDDAFIRRVHLDLLGTPAEQPLIAQFVADSHADKRTKLVNKLLRRSTVANKSCTACHSADAESSLLISQIVPTTELGVWLGAAGQAGAGAPLQLLLNNNAFGFVGTSQPVQPDDLSISITRKGQSPLQIVARRGEQTWEATEADYREKLPEDVRPHVESMLGGRHLDSTLKLTGVTGFDLRLGNDGRRGSSASGDKPPTIPNPAEVLQKLDGQLEALHARFSELRKAVQQLQQRLQTQPEGDKK
jgi:hypothetical protein